MECPYCGSELEWDDTYGTSEYILYGNEKFKNGDIYKCPNREGVEEICDSSCFNGFFYTDKQENLHEGYPC